MEIIQKKLIEIIGKQRNSSLVGLLYSGGLDSSIIAKIMVSIMEPTSILLLSVGLSDSYDMKTATFGSKHLGINLHKYYLTEDEVMKAIRSLKQLNIIQHPVALSIAIPIFLGMQKIATDFDTKTIFLGQGADELFGGYQKYAEIYKSKGGEDTRKIMNEDLQSLQNDQVVRERKIAHHFGLDIIYPYLDPDIINRAKIYPISTHIEQTSQGELIRKALLRKLAQKIGLPLEITKQPKKAIQYGSGTTKLIRKIVKSSNCQNISEWFRVYFQPDFSDYPETT
ncbi:MAG: asparagine synthase C-terminal domain-containing protein [Candidatus Thorarchaeota archaeon]